MNKKNMQKLNRAAVAAILAASGAAIAVPSPVTKAASPFKDIKATDSHYDAIISLYNRNIISGFEDNTFRPSQTVTRGQAAKMLALTIGLDVKNVSNPNFKDVSKNSSYYGYIAALAELNVISGFADKTFRPNEPITRSQMAKILVKGFEFMEATSLNHNFTDVSATQPNRYYIQTLLNLGVTTGTSSVTYSPAARVTRGQLASFLVRAENATVSTAKIKEVTKVEIVSGVTYVYLNGVKHTVSASLKNIFNTTNAQVLKGAYVEGTIAGKDIRSVSKLTINANGAANNILKFDGSNATFKGNVAVTGSYIRFSNWNVAGEFTIEDASITAVSQMMKPIQLNTVASLANTFGAIDWGQTEDPSGLNPDNNVDDNLNEDLIDIPTGNKPARPTLSNVSKHIEFVNSTVQQLIILSNRTYVKADKKLPNVTVAGFVRSFEINGDMKALYIDTDTDTAFYGVSDIGTIYKNGYKSVDLYADSITGLIVADNSSGWIDLGDSFYVDKVIIPPKTMPNDIFNDFLNDNDKIGDIEDPSGKDIDRDPIENTIVPDWEPPTLTIKTIQTNLATATVTVNSDETGTVYYLVKKEIDGEPSIREIIQYTGKMGGYVPVTEGVDQPIKIEGLEDETSYIFYAVAMDEAGNVSIKKQEQFEILDATPPVIKPFDVKALPGGQRLEVNMTVDEPGEYYYYYEQLPISGMPNEYTTENILTYAANGTQNVNYGAGRGTVSTAGEFNFRIPGLKDLTSYVVYVVMKDKAGNMMVEPVHATATTTELDNTPPRVVGTELKRVGESYEFTFEVTEALDPVTANDPNNYELFGTAILNIEGQPTTIKPEYIKYEEGSRKVTIRIPSATALVNGDTIQVKVLPGVTDLAENPFSNINVESSIEQVRNTVTYYHSDTLAPVISNQEVMLSPDKKTAYLQFDANKAGTYYYMIIADDFDWAGKDKEDFYEDFVKNPSPNLFPLGLDSVLSKYGDERNNAVVVGTQSTISIDIPQTVNPFKSYSIHLIMRDRSGNLSNKVIIPVINDKKAPFINELVVKPTEGSNTSVDIRIGSSELGKMYYKRIPKYTIDPLTGYKVINDDLTDLQTIIDNQKTTLFANSGNLRAATDLITQTAVAEIDTWTKVGLNEGSTEYTHSGLSPHEEYVYYFAFEDISGNLTIFEEQLPTTTPQSYTNTLTTKSVYTDGITPTVKPIFKKALQSEYEDGNRNNVINWGSSTTVGDGIIEYVPEKTFKATFSEALTLDTSSSSSIPLATNDTATLNALKTYIEKQSGSGSVKDIEWQNTSTIGTYEERMLVVTFNSTVTGNITIDMTDSDLAKITDLAGKVFYKDPLQILTTGSYADYKYPTAVDSIIRSAYFDPNDFTPTGVSPTFSSKFVKTQVEIGTEASWSQDLYYITTNKSKTDLSDSEIDKVIKSIETNNRLFLTDITIYGKEVIDAPSKLYTLSVADMPGYVPTDYFHTDQNLFIFTKDQYGNIVWALNEDDSTKKYRKIVYTP